MVLRPESGLGAPGLFQARLNGESLLRDRDYRLGEDSASLQLAFMPSASDTLCLDVYHSPLLPQGEGPWLKLEAVPVWSESVIPDEDSAPGWVSPSESVAEPYNLEYGGSHALSLSVGEGGGLGLDQALFLDIKGQLAANVFVEGHLSDQNVPIQPEGNTATLKEVDAVYVRIYGENYSYMLGDYLLRHGNEGVDGFTAKVEGVQAEYGRGELALGGHFSSSEGQYRTDTLWGVDGKQRGYYLRGSGGNRFVTVLSGTETVYRNGEKLQRGRHYTIDYSEGRIDFLKEVIVTSENLFSVEYQYTTQDFPRYLYGGELADRQGPWQWSVRAVQEWENKDHPLRMTLDESRLEKLRNLGDEDPASDTALGNLAPPRRQSSAVAESRLELGENHHSHLVLQATELDRNLYSPLDDGDNFGYSAQYRAKQSWGRPLGEGGFGRLRLGWDHQRRSRHLQTFKQHIDPRAFSDAWNLNSQVGERDFRADVITVEDQLWPRVLIGGEMGLARAGGEDSQGEGRLEVRSLRQSGFARLGGDKSFLRIESGMREASAPLRADNYRQSGLARLEAGGLVPEAAWTRNEWIAATGGDSKLTRSIKEEADFKLAFPRWFERLQWTPGISLLRHHANFDGRLETPRDSVRSLGIRQDANLFRMGPWSSDIFHSWRRHELWRMSPEGIYSTDPEASDYVLTEWNNQLQDPARGYSFSSSYRISRTAQVPLINDYAQVPSGQGDYLYDEVLDLYQPVEVGGDFILVGLKRDEGVGEIPYQESGWLGDIHLRPGRFPISPGGFLADIQLQLDWDLRHQDSTGDYGLIPLFTDAQIEKVFSGASRYHGLLTWRHPKGARVANFTLERLYDRAAGERAFREKRWREKADFRHEWSSRWEYTLFQTFESRGRSSLKETGGAAEGRSRAAGGELTRHFPRAYDGKVAMEFSHIEGGAGGFEDENAAWYGFKPRLRAEKGALYDGRAFLEYGLEYFRGSGEAGLYAAGGNRLGLTHRVEAGANFRVGAHMFLYMNYVARREPDRNELLQRFSAEARASF